MKLSQEMGDYKKRVEGNRKKNQMRDEGRG